MSAFVLALWLLVAGGVAALLARANDRAANVIGAGSAIAGSLLALGAALWSLLQLGAGHHAASLRLAWSVPLGAFTLELDALSAFFVLPAALLGALSAWFGAGYLPRHAHGRRLGPPWFFYNLLVGGMLLAVVAHDGLLFLFAWEVMSIAAYFLVTFDGHDEGVRDAGFVYLVATQAGTAFLLAFFALLGTRAGSLDYGAIVRSGVTAHAPALAGGLFVLALVGFGAKAGLVPFHVWLPEAHPAAPSHVSALMSGAMIKVGLYGLFRALTLLGPPPAWWGTVLLVLGIVSAFAGVAGANAQRDLKRLLAYSTVENAGLVTLALGLAVLANAAGNLPVTVLALAGALVHVLAHALFKGALFLGAGVVKDATHTLALDRLGGLWKRLGAAGPVVLVAALAAAGLPLFAGFFGEFLVLVAALVAVSSAAAHGAGGVSGPAIVAVLLAVPLIGGLAVAACTRLFGTAFLGEPRTADAQHAVPVAGAMKGALVTIGVLVLVAGLAGAWVLFPLAVPVLASGTHPAGLPAAIETARWLLLAANAVLLGVLALGVVAALLRRALLAGREIGETGTWDCGYALPSARMQYTATSFGLPLAILFGALSGMRARVVPPAGFFPAQGTASVEVAGVDALLERAYRPAAHAITRGLGVLRWIQHGRVQYYVLYVALTLLALLFWKFGR